MPANSGRRVTQRSWNEFFIPGIGNRLGPLARQVPTNRNRAMDPTPADTNSRAAALAEGHLVDCSQLAAEVGFPWPVAMTPNLVNEIDAAKSGKHAHWDVLFDTWLATAEHTRAKQDVTEVEVASVLSRKGKGVVISLVLFMGEGDEAEPVITLATAEEAAQEAA